MDLGSEQTWERPGSKEQVARGEEPKWCVARIRVGSEKLVSFQLCFDSAFATAKKRFLLLVKTSVLLFSVSVLERSLPISFTLEPCFFRV